MREFLLALGLLIKLIVEAIKRHWAIEEKNETETQRADLAKEPGKWFDNHFGPNELPRKDGK